MEIREADHLGGRSAKSDYYASHDVEITLGEKRRG